MPIRPVRTVLATEKEIAEICDKAREKIYAQVLDHYNRHPGSAWSGHYLVDLEKSIKAMYKKMGVDIGGSFRTGLPKTMREFYDRAAADMKKMGRRNAILGAPDAERVSFFLNNSFSEIAMRTQKMSTDHIRQLREISADVLRTSSLTGATRAQVTKEMLGRASEIPGFKFTAANGAVWKDKTYFTMLARTELMNAGRAAYDDKCAEEGSDVMMLDFSGNCCESCAKWEGQLFSLTGATPGLPTKADLEADGVFHPNCTHSYSAVPDYIREKDFNADGSPKTGGIGHNHENDVPEPVKDHEQAKSAPVAKAGKTEDYTSLPIDEALERAQKSTEKIGDELEKSANKHKLEIKKLTDEMHKKSAECNDLMGKYFRGERTPEKERAWQDSMKECEKLRKKIKDLQDVARREKYALITLPDDKRGTVSVFTKSDLSGRKTSTATSFIERLLGKNQSPGCKFELVKEKPGREYYDNRKVHISMYSNPKTIVHEICHGIELENSHIRRRCEEFLEYRCKGEPRQRLCDLFPNVGYEPDEVCRKDHFFSPYCGKDYYVGGKRDGTELLSMGVERMFEDPVGFYKRDKEYFSFVFNVMRGVI